MNFTPLRITLIYFAFAIVWITTTDALLEWLVADVQMLSQLQTAKGLFYITITAVALFFMMKSYEKHISKNESKLKEQEQSLNLALDSAAMATWKYFADGDYYITSEKHHQLFGYDKNHDLSLSDVLERIHPDDIETFMAGARETLNNGTEFNQKYRVVIPGEKTTWLWTRGKAQIDAGIVKTVSGVTIDITENKELEMQLEIERERLEKLFERIPILINVYDGDENLISINKYHEDVLGWTEEDFNESSMLELCYPDPEYREEVRKDIKSLYKGWKEYRVRSKSGEVRDQLWTNVMLSDNTFVGIGYDITERKQLEGQLMKEREELEKIFDNMPVFINIHDQESGIASANKYFEERMGYSSDFIRNHDLIATMTQGSEKNQVIEAIEESDGKWRDFELTTASGEILKTTWVNIKISRNKSLGIGLDITERKKMEEELRDKEESLRLITVSSNVGLWEWWPKTGKTKFDEIWAELVGYKLEELEPVSIKTWNRLLHPEDHDKFEAAIEEYYTGKSSAYECEVRMKHKDGHWVWILDRGRAVEWDENGDVLKMVGTHIDITDRKRYEQENQLLANVFTRSNTPLSVSNHNSNKLERVNEAYVNLLGYSEQELIGMKIEDLYPKESVRFVKEKVEELDRDGFVSFNTQLKKCDGSLFDAIVNLSLIRDEKFQDPYRISTVQDISELKEVQRELANERNRFELIAKSSNDVLYEMDIQSKKVWWSEGWTSSFGYRQQDVSEEFSWWDERLHPDDHDRVFESYLNALNTDREYWSDKYRFMDAKGNYRWVLDKGFFVTNRKGEKTFLVGTISDITSDELAKEELKRSEEQYRLLFKQSPLPMYIYDPESYNIISVNNSAIEKYGYSEKELLNMKIYDLHPESDLDEIMNEIRESIKKPKTGFDVWLQEAKDGSKIIAEISGSEIYYENKKQRLVIANDITEQRKAEEKAISAIIEGEERERQRIAKELHDGLGQYLSAANMNLQAVYEDAENLDKELKGTYWHGIELLNHAITETRNISQNLLPKAIQDYGLELAIESLVKQLEKIHPIKFYFYRNLNGAVIPDSIQINLYRIAQEALNNAIRHGKPKNISVQLVHSEGEILFIVEDDGTGFDTENLQSEGLGLRSMKTRVGAMSANLDIVSTIDRGTIISVVVPL